MIFRHLKIKIFCIFILLINITYALDFSKCGEFYLNTSKDFNGIRAIHIGNGQYLAYVDIPLHLDNVIKKDDILGLYLFSGTKLKNKFDLRDINKRTPVIAINTNLATQNKTIKGKILDKQKSFNNFAVFSKHIDKNSIISDICYQFYGISIGENKFIDKTYIDNFLQTKNPQYSYIGIFVIDDKNGVVVDSINPLINNAIHIGDLIKSINGKDIKDSNDFIDLIALSKPDSNIKLKVERDSKFLEIDVKTVKQNTSFTSNTSFLEPFNIILSNDLFLLTNSYGFKIDDRILRVNQIKVNTIKELNEAIFKALQKSDELSFLIVRNKFELFITLKNKK